jgi:hypothetical protein
MNLPTRKFDVDLKKLRAQEAAQRSEDINIYMRCFSDCIVPEGEVELEEAVSDDSQGVQAGRPDGLEGVMGDGKPCALACSH